MYLKPRLHTHPGADHGHFIWVPEHRLEPKPVHNWEADIISGLLEAESAAHRAAYRCLERSHIALNV